MFPNTLMQGLCCSLWCWNLVLERPCGISPAEVRWKLQHRMCGCLGPHTNLLWVHPWYLRFPGWKKWVKRSKEKGSQPKRGSWPGKRSLYSGSLVWTLCCPQNTGFRKAEKFMSDCSLEQNTKSWVWEHCSLTGLAQFNPGVPVEATMGSNTLWLYSFQDCC